MTVFELLHLSNRYYDRQSWCCAFEYRYTVQASSNVFLLMGQKSTKNEVRGTQPYSW